MSQIIGGGLGDLTQNPPLYFDSAKALLAELANYSRTVRIEIAFEQDEDLWIVIYRGKWADARRRLALSEGCRYRLLSNR